MPVVTKFKIYNTGRMDAGQFVEDDSTSVKLQSNSEAHVAGLDETGTNVKFTSEGVAVANEFREI